MIVGSNELYIIVGCDWPDCRHCTECPTKDLTITRDRFRERYVGNFWDSGESIEDTDEQYSLVIQSEAERLVKKNVEGWVGRPGGNVYCPAHSEIAERIFEFVDVQYKMGRLAQRLGAIHQDMLTNYNVPLSELNVVIGQERDLYDD
jgi:hypothetical protein